MWLRVAQWLHCTPSEARRRCTVRDFQEITAMWLIDPWTLRRVDSAGAIVAATVASTMTRKNYTPDRFMPTFLKAKLTDGELEGKFRAFARQHNAMNNAGGRGHGT
tara:strand:- start:1531 stop:1848 length:318 start_codon:yes stop_codon:yes gene_type:complete